MENRSSTITVLLVLLLLFANYLSAQTIISQFDFNSMPLTNATVGPNGLSADPDATTNGSEFLIGANCGSLKGLDLVVPNTGGVLDQPEMGMTFAFRAMEGFASFYKRGLFEFYIRNSQIYINWAVDNGLGGPLPNGPIPTGYNMPADNQIHEYTYLYTMANGMSEIFADGLLVWSFDGPDGRPLYWTGAGNAIIGQIMDGNCTGPGVLDYAYLFIPAPLPVEFVSFTADLSGQDALLNWETTAEYQNDFYTVEHSHDALDFEEVAFVPAQGQAGSNYYQAEVPALTPGTHFFRILQTDLSGNTSLSEVRTLVLEPEEGPQITVWPNPSQGQITLDPGTIKGPGRVRIVDMRGSLRADFPLEGVSKLDLSHLGPGMYIIQVVAGGVNRKSRLVIE
ncbi:MAG: T9SS type A sorting domain-containing protein [Bacteroidia bacterium]|nr:T9SS type A sorting domain-containing protein [Bacteroidia bacterium]